MPYMPFVRFGIRVLAGAVGFWIASRIVPGVHTYGVYGVLAAALLLGVFNALLRPVLVILTLPFTILTLGLFLFVVNGLVVLLLAMVVPSIRIPNLWQAIPTALIISLVSWVAAALTAETMEGFH